MILISQLQAYCDDLADRIPGLNHSLVVADESHLIKELANLDQSHYPLLVASYPMAQSQGKTADSATFTTAIIFYVLFKDDQRGRTFAQEHAQHNSAQAITLQLAHTLLTDVSNPQLPCHFAQKIDPSSLTIEPENLLAGCEGWTLSASYQNVPLPQNFEELNLLYPQSFNWLIENW